MILNLIFLLYDYSFVKKSNTFCKLIKALSKSLLYLKSSANY